MEDSQYPSTDLALISLVLFVNFMTIQQDGILSLTIRVHSTTMSVAYSTAVGGECDNLLVVSSSRVAAGYCVDCRRPTVLNASTECDSNASGSVSCLTAAKGLDACVLKFSRWISGSHAKSSCPAALQRILLNCTSQHWK